MALTSGTRVGPYEIVAPIGAGGMGEVYRANDPRLGRSVAIKVLPEDLAKDPERLARFEREARVLASLNHAGIASVFGVEDAGSSRGLVMELVEGPTLSERIAQGALAPDEALPIARQLAEAIEYAHDRGIVHRDLKPDNVKLRPDGTVKVLDFGLARALDAEPLGPTGDLRQSPTITQRTSAGMILGTAAYMSPEQARGRDADRRADVWAFGAVVYEMLAGRRPFGGDTISDTLASVMRDEPDWSALPKGLSPRWERLLRRCLAKDARQRLQAIGEARIALDEIAANPGEPVTTFAATTGPTAVSPVSKRSRVLALAPWLITAAAVVTLYVGLSGRPRSVPASGPTELSVLPSGAPKIGADIGYNPLAISPDGRLIAYTIREEGQLRLRLRRLDAREDVGIPGADGARNLFFSRDSQWLAFFDTRKMSKVSVRGGTPIALTDTLQDRLGTWLDDGTIVFTRDTTEPLYRMPESGGTPKALTTLDASKRERTHRFPSALAGGPWVVFTVQSVDSPGGYDDASIDAVSVATGERRHLFTGARRAAWVPGGYLVLARGNDLYAVPIDPNDPKITQEPVPVVSGVSGQDSSGSSYFSIADDGTLAWIPGGEPEKTREVGWLDRSGRWTPVPFPPGPYLRLRLAPDGARALVTSGPGGGNEDLWLTDLRTGGMNRLTSGGTGGPAVWLPDGRIAYSRASGGGDAVVVRRLDGSGGERVIHQADHPLNTTDVTPDGRSVLFCDYGQRKGRIYLASLDARGGNGRPMDAPTGGAGGKQEDGAGTATGAGVHPMPVEGEGYEQAGMVSPDGRWLAYTSTKTHREEVCVRRLNGGGGSWQVSTGGGGGIRWGRLGRELFFVTGETLMRASISVRGDDLTVGPPEKLFEMPPSPTEASFRDYAYDPLTDRFLITRPPKGTAEMREIAVSLGWAGRLGEKVRKAGR